MVQNFEVRAIDTRKPKVTPNKTPAVILAKARKATEEARSLLIQGMNLVYVKRQKKRL